MSDDARPDLEKVHPRPEQAETPVDDIGASDVDLDEARHGDEHASPAVPETGHAPDDHGAHGHDDHGHGDHDDHGDHPVEDPRWVLAPVAVGILVGIVLVVFLLGLNSGAEPFHSL